MSTWVCSQCKSVYSELHHASRIIDGQRLCMPCIRDEEVEVKKDITTARCNTCNRKILGIPLRYRGRKISCHHCATLPHAESRGDLILEKLDEILKELRKLNRGKDDY